MIDILRKTLMTLKNIENSSGKCPISDEEYKDLQELLINYEEACRIMNFPLERLKGKSSYELEENWVYLFRFHQRFVYEYYILKMRKLIGKCEESLCVADDE